MVALVPLKPISTPAPSKPGQTSAPASSSTSETPESLPMDAHEEQAEVQGNEGASVAADTDQVSVSFLVSCSARNHAQHR